MIPPMLVLFPIPPTETEHIPVPLLKFLSSRIPPPFLLSSRIPPNLCWTHPLGSYVDFIYYYTFSSLTLFWLAESLQWIFEISARDVKTCRLYNNHVKVTSNHVKVTGNHVMYDRAAWFLKVIMSSSRALCCLALAKKQKNYFNFFRSMYNKKIIRFGFCDIQNNRGLGKGYQPQPTASADNPYLDLDYSGYHKNLIQ